MLLRWRRTTLVVAICVLSAGCNLFAGDCTTLGHAAIELSIVDGRTNRMPSVPSFITVVDSPFVATHPREGQPAVIRQAYDFAVERLGNYSIRIETVGYATWERKDIKVLSLDRCGSVKPVKVKAELQPQ